MLRISPRENLTICTRGIDRLDNLRYNGGVQRGFRDDRIEATGCRSMLQTRPGALLPGGLGRLLGEAVFKRACENELLALFIAARLGPMVVLGYKTRIRWT